MTATEDAERKLGRAVAYGLPLAGIVAAVLAGVTASVGSAILVLASTALLSTIALLWASLRTLSGDAPLPSALEAHAVRREEVDALSEKKRRVLRALKDLENERSLGKIDAADYADVAGTYREEAKSVMRAMEAEVAPALEEAERVARDYLKRNGTNLAPPTATPSKSGARVTCLGCSASNEPDAAFCKGCGARLDHGGQREAHAKE
jgi:uncharacterized membrane protein